MKQQCFEILRKTSKNGIKNNGKFSEKPCEKCSDIENLTFKKDLELNELNKYFQLISLLVVLSVMFAETEA